MAKILLVLALLLVSSISYAFDFNGDWEGDGYLSENSTSVHQKLRIVISINDRELNLGLCSIELDKDHEPFCVESEYLINKENILRKVTQEKVGEITDSTMTINDAHDSVIESYFFELTDTRKMKANYDYSTNNTVIKNISGNLIRE